MRLLPPTTNASETALNVLFAGFELARKLLVGETESVLPLMYALPTTSRFARGSVVVGSTKAFSAAA